MGADKVSAKVSDGLDWAIWGPVTDPRSGVSYADLCDRLSLPDLADLLEALEIRDDLEYRADRATQTARR